MSHRLDLKVGFACQNHCDFCVQGDKRTRVRAPSGEELRAALAAARPRSTGVVFTGGEPTLRKDLPALLVFARRLGYREIQVQTNGRRLSERGYAELLASCGASEFAPSLHGHTPAIHDGLTRAPGSFAETVAGIREVVRLRRRVLTNSVITQANHDTLPELAELLVSLGVSQMQFAFVHALGTAEARFDEVVPRLRDVAPHLARALRVGLAAGVRATAEAVPYCVLPGLEQCVAERSIPETTVLDVDHVIDDYGRYRWDRGKLRGPRCAECAHAPVCEGPWREYPERFGWDEMVPVPRAG